MAKKDISKFVEQTGGLLRHMKSIELTVTDQGTGSDNIDFTIAGLFEAGRKTVNYIKIINDGGVNDVFYVFDAAGSTINTLRWRAF